MNRSISAQAFGLAGWLLLCLAAGAIGALASADAGTFYASLVRPAWAPPGWLFGPVWTALYVMMGISAWLVWRQHGFNRALSLFLVQLSANALWTWLFFVWHQGALAFGEILLLWALIVAAGLSFWRLSRLAAVLLLPYLAWVSFASALTYATWTMNPEIL